MPPIRSQSSSNSTEQEGRLLLAIQAIKKQEIRTIAAAARTFNIPRSTLRDRLNGHTERSTILFIDSQKDLRRQASSIKALLCTRSRSPPSPSDRALNQLVKGFRLTMQGAILFAKENKDLRAANEKQKQKRTRSRRQIPAEEGLSVQEASALITEPVEAIEAPISSMWKA
ncbi:Helix-turn-helix, Psq [Penicillium camemberti]|uniref:Helix-turn-helix, Psq n=1 Tax=Penicillium camemberti (strain FM 013) TaxID=1429867 RepID=A0A0G4PKM3_PENC3|nr:Helix-turn-helix, Psq [Penicillium camemberti]